MDTFAYKLLLLLHILAVIVAFAPAFVWPVVTVKLVKEGKDPGSAIGALAAGNNARIHGPALVLVGLFGFGLVGVSDQVWEFSQAWVSIAVVLWFAMLGVLFGLLVPAEKRAATGDVGAGKRVGMFNGIISLLLLVMLVDMIWKPFL